MRGGQETGDRCMAGKGEGKSERRGGSEREMFFQFHFCCGSVINLQSRHFEWRTRET